MPWTGSADQESGTEVGRGLGPGVEGQDAQGQPGGRGELAKETGRRGPEGEKEGEKAGPGAATCFRRGGVGGGGVGTCPWVVGGGRQSPSLQ